ncbi:hypothetical protein [Microcystis phage Mwe-JY08]
MTKLATDEEIGGVRHWAKRYRGNLSAAETLRLLARLDAERAALATAKAKIDEIAAYAVQQGRVLAEQEARAEAAEAKLAKAREALCDAVACLGGFYSDRVPQSIRDAILANIDTGGGDAPSAGS